MDHPETLFVWSGPSAIAYQAFGEGSDLLYLAGYASNVELNWVIPPRLASSAGSPALDG